MNNKTKCCWVQLLKMILILSLIDSILIGKNISEEFQLMSKSVWIITWKFKTSWVDFFSFTSSIVIYTIKAWLNWKFIPRFLKCLRRKNKHHFTRWWFGTVFQPNRLQITHLQQNTSLSNIEEGKVKVFNYDASLPPVTTSSFEM